MEINSDDLPFGDELRPFTQDIMPIEEKYNIIRIFTCIIYLEIYKKLANSTVAPTDSVSSGVMGKKEVGGKMF